VALRAVSVALTFDQHLATKKHKRSNQGSFVLFVFFVAKKKLLLAAAVAEYGHLHGASSEAHRFA